LKGNIVLENEGYWKVIGGYEEWRRDSSFKTVALIKTNSAIALSTEVSDHVQS